MEVTMNPQDRAKLDQIIMRLQSSDSDERRWAIYDLEQLDVQLTVDLLVNSIQDVNRAVREAASEVLESLSPEVCTAKLTPLLGSERIEVRNISAAVLVKYGQSAVQELILALTDPNEDVRKFSADILGLARNPDAAPDLCTSALNDEVSTVAVSAVEALGKIGDPSALEALYELFDRQQGMEAEVVEAIGLIGGEASVEFLAKRLNHEDPVIVYAIIDAFGNLGHARALPTLFEYVSNAPDYLTDHISQAILKIGQVTNTIVLSSPETVFMSNVMTALMGGDEEVTALVLHQFRLKIDDAAMSEFFNVITDLPSNIVVGLIKHAKSHHHYSQMLIDLVKHEDDWVAYSALEAFDSVAYGDAVPVIMDILENYTGLRSLAALRAVEALKLVETREMLTNLARDAEDEVGIEAKRILEIWGT